MKPSTLLSSVTAGVAGAVKRIPVSLQIAYYLLGYLQTLGSSQRCTIYYKRIGD